LSIKKVGLGLAAGLCLIPAFAFRNVRLEMVRAAASASPLPFVERLASVARFAAA
jgi:hypothetical protein